MSIRDNFFPLTTLEKATKVAEVLKTSPEAVMTQGWITTTATVVIMSLVAIVLIDIIPRWIKLMRSGANIDEKNMKPQAVAVEKDGDNT